MCNPQPVEFINVAESGHIINELGNWVIKRALDDYQHIMNNFYNENVKLSINISPKQFNDKRFVLNLKTNIEDSGITPELIILELTETCLMNSFDQTRDAIIELSHYGVGFALDDFGTGYSSFQFLKHLPISYLKIDKSFIRDIPVDQSDNEIVKAMISLARELNMVSVAEGIENEEQLNFLRTSGCDQVQGFYLAKPTTKDNLAKYFIQYGVA